MKKHMPSAQRPRRSLVASTQAEWQAHIRALGLKTVEEYQAWCRRHGFRDRL